MAGIAFSLLLTTAFLLIRQAVPNDPDDAGDWLKNSSERNAVAGVWSFGRRTTYPLLNIYAMRIAAVFTISTTTIVARLKLVRGLILFGFATGAVLLIAVGFVPWLELIFPAWVFALSISILVATTRTPKNQTGHSPTIA